MLFNTCSSIKLLLLNCPVFICIAACTGHESKADYRLGKPVAKIPAADVLIIKQLDIKVNSTFKKAKSFARTNQMDTTTALILDLDMHSGLPRFAIVNLDHGKITRRGLVAHGQPTSAAESCIYSNKPGSLRSSKGRYKVGLKYTGSFGTSYKLHGLDSSNSNAFNRFIVLHAHECIPDTEVYPQHICVSNGCPTVSKNFLADLSSYISKTKKPMLLWIL